MVLSLDLRNVMHISGQRRGELLYGWNSDATGLS